MFRNLTFAPLPPAPLKLNPFVALARAPRLYPYAAPVHVPRPRPCIVPAFALATCLALSPARASTPAYGNKSSFYDFFPIGKSRLY